ncbi:MAG: lytic transglycosylase domain-containing protein [Fimbriimonadaceae bacterium]|nr:lytic transglycosylase domain-containing protein [Fimbriimonadaceae bacterium]
MRGRTLGALAAMLILAVAVPASGQTSSGQTANERTVDPATVAQASNPPTAEAYLAQRTRYGIRHHVLPAAGKAIVGAKIVEVRGIVKGTVTTPNEISLIFDWEGTEPMSMAVTELPAWLQGDEVPIRAIARLQRDPRSNALQLSLIFAAPIGLVPDLKPPTPPAKPTAKPGAKKPTRNTKPAASRSATRAIRPGENIGRVALAESQALPYYVAFVRGQNPSLSEAAATKIARNVIYQCVTQGVDARLVMAVVLVESGFDPFAVSKSGARGLGQLMSGTASDLGVDNRFDIEQNVYGLVRYLRKQLETYIRQTNDHGKALQLALAAYNAGPGAVKKYGGIPPYRETVNYVRKITAIYAKLCGAK